MNNKEKYSELVKQIFVPIYSKPWWMDAVCGEDNWDVWLYEKDGRIEAAMPYYKEKRGDFNYITKAPLTQNNGIVFNYRDGIKFVAKEAFEEKVINKACEFIRSLGVDVYEQQYQYTFDNWLPFFWNFYTAITRYTYVFEDTKNLDKIWDGMSAKQRSIIRKGEKNSRVVEGHDPIAFYTEHEKIFKKQGLECPFSFELWERLYKACKENDACKIIYAVDDANNITSLIFLVWDERSMYHLLAGSMPEFQSLDTYSYLTWEAIKMAAASGLKYDFEGSVIKRISKSVREFGPAPKPYFRIRKIFNSSILRDETEDIIERDNGNK